MNILPENHARAEIAVETFDVVLNLFQLVLELGENVFPHVTFCFKFLPRQFAKILLCLCDFNDGIDLIFHLHVRVFPSENHGLIFGQHGLSLREGPEPPLLAHDEHLHGAPLLPLLGSWAADVDQSKPVRHLVLVWIL